MYMNVVVGAHPLLFQLLCCECSQMCSLYIIVTCWYCYCLDI